MSKKFFVKVMTPRHLEDVMLVEGMTYARPDQDFGVLTMGPCGWEKDNWVNAVAEERQAALVCLAESTLGPLVVGACAYRRDPDRFTILHLVGLADADGPDQSVKKILLDNVENYTKKLGKDFVSVEVHDHDDDLAKLLAKWKFKPTPLRKHFPGEADGYLYSRRPRKN